MGRKTTMTSTGLGRIRDAVKRVFARGRSEEEAVTAETATPVEASAPRTAAAGTSRTVRRQTDVPLDVLDSYTPPATSSKSSFRSDGADHQQDQEFSLGVDESRWNDEDHFTNKSGDPRIGTRHRTYEPAESRTESRDEQR